MSLQALTGAIPTGAPTGTAAPIVNQTLEPASVRHGSTAVQQAYRSALAFEQVLVEQLAKSLTTGLGSEEEGESGEGAGAGAASSEISSTLPQALSSGVMNAGGLGMAAQMVQQMQARSAAPQSGAVSPSSGGTETSTVALPIASPSSGGTSA